jgi:hypothetical protein
MARDGRSRKRKKRTSLRFIPFTAERLQQITRYRWRSLGSAPDAWMDTWKTNEELVGVYVDAAVPSRCGRQGSRSRSTGRKRRR